MDPVRLGNGQLDIADGLRFYFWINVAGITTITDCSRIDGKPHEIFSNMGQGQAYCMVNPKNKNGFKVMNDQRELMRLMLPEVNNVGEQYKQLVDKKRV